MVKGLGREREKERRWSPVHSVLHPMVARTGILEDVSIDNEYEF